MQKRKLEKETGQIEYRSGAWGCGKVGRVGSLERFQARKWHGAFWLLGYYVSCCCEVHLCSFLSGLVFTCPGCMFRSGIAVSFGNSISPFKVELPDCFPKWLYCLPFPSAGMRIPISPQSCSHVPLSVFLIVATLEGVECCLTVKRWLFLARLLGLAFRILVPGYPFSTLSI